VDVAALQARISATFGARDRARGLDGTFRRLVEELGEVAKAIRGGDRAAVALELSDLLAWTISVAALEGVDLDGALARYAKGCPRCGESPCRCPADF
jgi:NTP pyrophosphatase (non-canonical NTP hydrolase)